MALPFFVVAYGQGLLVTRARVFVAVHAAGGKVKMAENTHVFRHGKSKR